MADRINMPKSIVDRANMLFKQVHDTRSLKGRSNDAIASACLYIACRQERVPRSFKVSCANFLLISCYLIFIVLKLSFFKGNLRY